MLCLFAGLAVSVVVEVVPASGWLGGAAILAGALAYAMMATNLLLAVRRPGLERLFGPLDRVYSAHRVIGTSVLAVIGVHLVLIPIASAVERGESLLEDPSPAIPLGVAGLLLLAGSIGLSVSSRVPYDRWQRVHAATGGAFLLLTAHMAVGAGEWFGVTGPAGLLLGCFAALGVVSFTARLIGKAHGGVRYVVTETIPRERSVEIVMKPEGDRTIATHQPGQFAFLTADSGKTRETHPFTLISPRGDDQVSVLIRSSGDWTSAAQTGIAVGERVRLEGPFGAFTPALDAPGPQRWIAGGAGITPFLSVLRTARGLGERSRRDPIELIVAARDKNDAPCWTELADHARHLPWLTLAPAFSAEGARLDRGAIERHASGDSEATDWYVCGPPSLVALVGDVLDANDGHRLHTERYQWRGPAQSPR